MAQYDKSFKEEALALSDDIGPKKAAEQLGIPYYTIASWRRDRKRYGNRAFVGSGHKQLPADPKDREIHELKKELTEIKRANEILQEALGFFAVSRKK